MWERDSAQGVDRELETMGEVELANAGVWKKSQGRDLTADRGAPGRPAGPLTQSPWEWLTQNKDRTMSQAYEQLAAVNREVINPQRAV